MTTKKEIIEEGLRWVQKNKGYKSQKGGYTGPRISSEIPDCSMPMTFDSYSFCSLGCLYCFAYVFKCNNPAIQGHGQLKSLDTSRLVKSMSGKAKDKMGELFWRTFYRHKFLLHWGGLADPFCNFERHNKFGYPFMRALGEMDYPTLFSFKGDTIFDKRYVKLFEKYSKQKNFAFQVSIITANDELAKQLEIGVPSPTKRIEAIRMLSGMGYWTILRLRPFIVGVTDSDLDELLERSLDAGINGVSCEFFAMDARADQNTKKRYEWLAELVGVDNLHKYFAALSPSERGGYMRLNRLVKEPYVRKIYEFCAEHDLVCAISDPDFKELNTSGSCCGMPDHYPDNPGLEQWSRAQSSFALKEARKRYHKTGKLKELRFDEVYPENELTEYMDIIRLSNEHVSVIGKIGAERTAITLRMILQDQWNNLRSPANPRNYYHGKIIPVGVDESNNLVFRYNSTEYEERWAKEGVDLTR